MAESQRLLGPKAHSWLPCLAGVGELRITVHRVRLQYKKALEKPFCVISLVAQDGTVIEEARTAAGGWDKPNQVIVLEASASLITRVTSMPAGECCAASPPLGGLAPGLDRA